MKKISSNTQSLPIKIVGGNAFGKYPKISAESTFNMYITDGWLTSFAGYKKIININPQGTGRGCFNSSLGGFLIAVIDNAVYTIDEFGQKKVVGNLESYSGDVFIDENDAQEIAISDLANKIRHTYDIYKILSNKELNDFFYSNKFDELLLKASRTLGALKIRSRT